MTAPRRAGALRPVDVDRTIGDGDMVRLGGVTLTAILTPGLTKGCVSSRTQLPGADGRGRSVLFHCSSMLAGQTLAPTAYPNIVADDRPTFKPIRDFSADIFLTGHPEAFDMVRQRLRVHGSAGAAILQ